MGHGIGQVHAAIGKRVTLYEPDLARAEAGRARIAGNLDRAVAKGKLRPPRRDAILARVTPPSDMDDVHDADLVVEAVFEDVAVKQALWQELDVRAPAPDLRLEHQPISIDRLAAALSADRDQRRDALLQPGPGHAARRAHSRRGDRRTRPRAAIRELTDALGKKLIVSADRPGFIVNRILMPLLAEAMRTLEEGTGTADDIDTGAKVGLNHPMGPLELADFIGLDVCLNVMKVLHEGIGGEHFRPPKVLEDLVAAGHLGQKTGRGFILPENLRSPWP